MDALRHFQHAQTFRLLAQDLAGRLTVERLADHLSALADTILDATLARCWLRTARAPAPTPPRFAIIGYGKLGGKELGYASDLDLVFLYDARTRRATARRSATRGSRSASTRGSPARTGAGRLYETDLRLRPDGASGLLVSSVDGFERYQREQAWTWEHQALTRARFVAGDAAIGAAFEATREAVLRLPRDRGEARGRHRRHARAHGAPSTSESHAAVRPEARRRRHGRHRVRRAVPRARARARASAS